MAEEKQVTRKLTQTYPVRADNSVTVPVAVQDMLQWKYGDQISYEIDLTDGKLILKKSKGSVAQ